jgi:hypothetical protein
MAEELWFYLQNPFDNVTKHSFALMNLLATDHHDKLRHKANLDARFAPLYQDFESTYKVFKTVFTKSLSNAGRYQSNTQKVESLFTELTSTRIRKWDVKIQNEYDEMSNEYVSILPSGRKPFQVGGYEARINEVKALYERLNYHPNLANLAAEVKQFAYDLEQARTEQQGFEQAERELSQSLESARVELAKVMYGVFVRLKYLHLNELKQVETYYELQYLRKTGGKKETEEPPTDTDITAIPE